jgi:hypothetical protein
MLSSTNEITEISVTMARRRKLEHMDSPPEVDIFTNAAAAAAPRWKEGLRELDQSSSVMVTFTIDVKLDQFGFSSTGSESADHFAEELITSFVNGLIIDLYDPNGNFVAAFTRASGATVVVTGDDLATMVDTIRTEFTSANANLAPTAQPTLLPTALLNRDYSDSSRSGVSFGFVIAACVFGGSLCLLATPSIKGYFVPQGLRRALKIRVNKIAPETTEFLEMFPQYSSPPKARRVSPMLPASSTLRLENYRHQRQEARRAALEEEFGPIPQLGRTEFGGML